MAKIEKKITFDDIVADDDNHTFISKEKGLKASKKQRNIKILISLNEAEYDIFLEKKEIYRKKLQTKKNIPDAVFAREIILGDLVNK